MAGSEIYNNMLNLIGGIDLNEISDLDNPSFTVFRKYITDTNLITLSSITRLQGILDYTYEKINIGDWKEVRSYLRKTMTIGSYFKLLITVKESTEFPREYLKELYQIIDHGLLFGSPLTKEPMLLQKCAAILNKIAFTLDTPVINDFDIKLTQNTCRIHTRFRQVDRVDCPSIEMFYTEYLKKDVPVIMTGVIDHWPALTKWVDCNYFLRLAGLRTVPIEMGRKYTDHEWTQKLMTIEDFIKNHVLKDNLNCLGYLAQYQLFDHIPELLKDITRPDYLSFAANENDIEINSWYGPRGTVSPLHQDCKHNLFTQVVGEKSIYLFPPSDTDNLYPHNEDLLSNTAIIDPRHNNYVLFPKYANARGQHCILKPGEMLFVPKNWWHFVEALTICFSVSFWWSKTVESGIEEAEEHESHEVEAALREQEVPEVHKVSEAQDVTEVQAPLTE